MKQATHFFYAPKELFDSGIDTTTVYLPTILDKQPADYIPVLYSVTLEVIEITDAGKIGFAVFTNLDNQNYSPIFSVSKGMAAGDTDSIHITWPNGLPLRVFAASMDNYGLDIPANAMYTSNANRASNTPPSFMLHNGVLVATNFSLSVSYSYEHPSKILGNC